MKRVFVSVLLALVGMFAIGGAAVWAQSSSSSYQIEESFIGPGGNLESSSSNYSTAPGQQSVGNIGGGESESTNFQAQSGPTNTDDPSLTCSVTDGSVGLGDLSSSTPATGTATFRVLNYTAHGYAVLIAGDTPGTGSYNLAALSSGGSSSAGTEQFGINLVENTDPVALGADPQQVPDSTFSNGQAATNYDTADTYRYVEGETIALADESTGITDFTISYLANISNSTAGGDYTGTNQIICIGTY